MLVRVVDEQVFLVVVMDLPSCAMTSSAERTSAESKGSLAGCRTGGGYWYTECTVLPLDVSPLEQILGWKGFS